MKKLLGPLRAFGTVPALLWLYRNRRPITHLAALAPTVPSRVSEGRIDELTLDARARLVIVADPDLRHSGIRVERVDGRTIHLHGDLGDPLLERARRAMLNIGDDVVVLVGSDGASASVTRSTPAAVAAG